MHKSQADRITHIKTGHKREKLLQKFPKVKKRNGIWNARESGKWSNLQAGKFRNYCDATRCHKAGIIIGKADKR